MLTRLFTNSDAVTEAERFSLNLIDKNPNLAVWLPLAYHVASTEFQNPKGVTFEYNTVLDTVTKHTIFSKFIYELVYHNNIRNLPVRSISNGVGSSEIAAILFAIYAAILYIRLEY